METQIKQLVTEIIRRLAVRMGADGRNGRIIVAVSAATVGFSPAIEQLRQMVLGGYRLELFYSEHAQALHRDRIRDQLAGFPFITEVKSAQWLEALTAARAVVVPLLSLNTASKAALLIADTLPTNLVLHGLAAGKPVIMADNGARPNECHWGAKGNLRLISPGLQRAALKRLDTLRVLGCQLSDAARLNAVLNDILGRRGRPSIPARSEAGHGAMPRKVWLVAEHTITAAHVRHAHCRGADIELPHRAVVTPLAQEMAQRCRVALIPGRG